MNFPKLVEVRQKLPSDRLDDFVASIKSELRRIGLDKRVKAGSRIAITAGSRGIAHYAAILKTVVEEVKEVGGEPFLIPAMGSHGGATSKGQIEVLRTLGVTEEFVGAPIVSSMEVEEVGRLENGAPVYVDKKALEADGIIVVNRVKPHTDFKGKIESGLMKMMVIGLGKQKGAEVLHSYQAEGYHKLLPLIAKTIMRKTPIILGLAIVENAFEEVAVVKAIQPEKIEEEEVKLLKIAKQLIGQIPFKEVDLLIVDEIGKNISGLGMDTNVTGRFWIPGECEPRAPKIKRIVVLDLTDETHGNAIGIGMADLTTKRVAEKIDYNSTFVNSLTAGWPEVGRTPMFLPTDRDAIATAINTCGPINPQEAKIVRIKNTLQLNRMWISTSLLETLECDEELKKRLEILGKPKEIQFDVLGNLAR